MMTKKKAALGALLILACLGLTGCSVVGAILTGCDDGADCAVVFVCTEGAQVSSIGADGPEGGGGAQYANGAPMAPGESIALDTGHTGWPLEVTAYRGTDLEGAIASVVIPQAPAEGERWYVTLRDGALEYTSEWPPAG